jgi:hypothetical protein
MRNIIQYPITLDEICEALDQAGQEIIDSEVCGDMRPYLFQEAIRFMREAEESGLTYQQKV